MSIYSQGIAADGPVILRDGQPMTPEQIVEELNRMRDELDRAWMATEATSVRCLTTLSDVVATMRSAAPPIPRVEQEPVAWVLFDDIFIAPKDMQDDPPNLECMKPLYAHPLALREPTEDECRRIANEFLILGGPDELAGRVMFNAVREVMTRKDGE